MEFRTEHKTTTELLLWANTFAETVFKKAPLVLLSKEYEAYPESKLVHIGAFKPADEKMFRMFLDDIFSHFVNEEIDFEFLIFLHELGHIATRNDFTYEEMERHHKWVEEIESREHTTDNYLLEYYDLQVEWAATSWAVEYIIENINQVIELQKEYKKLLLNMRKNITQIG